MESLECGKFLRVFGFDLRIFPPPSLFWDRSIHVLSIHSCLVNQENSITQNFWESAVFFHIFPRVIGVIAMFDENRRCSFD